MLKTIMNLFTSPTTKSSEISKKPSLESPKKPGSEVKEEDGYYVWQKGENPVLSPYFSGREFSCKCSFPACKKQRISKTLIVRLDLIRKEVKQPLIVTSAYRCHEYQAFLRAAGINTGGAKQATHGQGNAADVVPKDGNIETFLPIAEKQFDSIGLAKNFLHLDLRVGKRRWNY